MISGPEALVGTTLGGFRLERVLGLGGMGAVYQARAVDDPAQLVAVKVLIPPWQAAPEERRHLRQRFLREAQVVSHLRHPHILGQLATGDAGADGAQISYLVMPLAPGGSLAQLLQQRDAPLPFAQIVSWLDQLASALDYAHSQGVVHRDLKPANILIGMDGRLLLADFGITHLFGTEQTRLTVTGQIMGTPNYIAPEQARSMPVTAAVDLYSLGVIAFELVTGRVPFSAPTPMEVLVQQVNTPPPSPRQWRPDLPPQAEAALLRAMAKDPASRWPSAAAFVQAFIDGLNAPDPTIAVPPPAPTYVPAGSQPLTALTAAGGRPAATVSGSASVVAPMPGAPVATRPVTRTIALLSSVIILILGSAGLLFVLHPWQSDGGTVGVTATATPTHLVLATQTATTPALTMTATTALTVIPGKTLVAPTATPTTQPIPQYPTSTPLPTVPPTSTSAPTATSTPTFNPNMAYTFEAPPPCGATTSPVTSDTTCKSNETDVNVAADTNTIYGLWPPYGGKSLAPHFSLTVNVASLGADICYGLTVFASDDYLITEICQNGDWTFSHEVGSNQPVVQSQGNKGTLSAFTIGVEFNRGTTTLTLNGGNLSSITVSQPAAQSVAGTYRDKSTTANEPLIVKHLVYTPLS